MNKGLKNVHNGAYPLVLLLLLVEYTSDSYWSMEGEHHMDQICTQAC